MSRASCCLPASFMVLRKLILMEMSHILRAYFTHYLVKAETQIMKKCTWEELPGHGLRWDPKSLEGVLEEQMLNCECFSEQHRKKNKSY